MDSRTQTVWAFSALRLWMLALGITVPGGLLIVPCGPPPTSPPSDLGQCGDGAPAHGGDIGTPHEDAVACGERMEKQNVASYSHAAEQTRRWWGGGGQSRQAQLGSLPPLLLNRGMFLMKAFGYANG